jgi:hypothetical protein
MNEVELHEALESLHKAQAHYEMDIAKYGGHHHMNYTPVEHEYASKGVAGSGLGLGIAGTALALLNGNGGLGGLLGGNRCGYVTEKELKMSQELAAKDAKIGLLEADKYTDQKISEVYANLDAKIERLRERQDAINVQQATLNATQTATIACMQGQVAQLLGLTKLVVPNTSVCPGWGNVTITPAAAPAAG